MNTLTKNRILETGDEYKDPRGIWKPVPPKDLGLQIMFTPYTEVRRPSETPKVSAPTTPAEPDPKPLTPLPEPEAAKDGLPTVVSAKAHKLVPKAIEAADPALDAMEAEERTIKTKARVKWVTPPVETETMRVPEERFKATYPKGSPQTIWIGRNGTFKSTAVQFKCEERVDGNVIQIRPEGKRGLAKNALIEFPVSVVPAIVDWLKKHDHSSCYA